MYFFETFYSLFVFYVSSRTLACKNFENLMNTKKVIDIYDYDYTLKALVGYNKLMCSISRSPLFHWLDQSGKNTHWVRYNKIGVALSIDCCV